MKDAVQEVLERGHSIDAIGEENILSQKTDTIGSLYPKLDAEICRRCTARIFPQCNRALPNGEPRVD